jgi:hypothetical protein
VVDRDGYRGVGRPSIKSIQTNYVFVYSVFCYRYKLCIHVYDTLDMTRVGRSWTEMAIRVLGGHQLNKDCLHSDLCIITVFLLLQILFCLLLIMSLALQCVLY